MTNTLTHRTLISLKNSLNLGKATDKDDFQITAGTSLWTDVDYSVVLKYLQKFKLPARCVGLASLGNDNSMVADFIIEKNRHYPTGTSTLIMWLLIAQKP